MDAEGRRMLTLIVTVALIVALALLGGWGVMHRLMTMVHTTTSTSK